jgi:hypothetical protein
MATVIYSMCALTACLCAWLLLRAYRDGGYRLLLWGGLCFVGLALSNILLVVDKIIFPTYIDLSMSRLITALGAMVVLLYGLIWEKE